MAPFPPITRTSSSRHRRPHLDWWPWLTLGLFLAAFLGLAADPTKNALPKAGVSSAESRSEIPHLGKRDPLRLVAASERRDNNTDLSRHDPGDGAVWHSMPASPGCESEGLHSLPACSSLAIPTDGFQPRAPPATV